MEEEKDVVRERKAEEQAAEQTRRPLLTLSRDDLRRPMKEKKKRKLAPRLIALGILVVLVTGTVLLVQSWKPAEVEREDASFLILQNEQENVESVTIEKRGEEPFTIHRTMRTEINADYKVRGWPDEIATAFAQTSGVFSIGINVRVEETVEENVRDLSVYGLDDPLSRMVVTLTNGQQFAFLLGNRLPTGVGYYMMEEGGTTVYRISDYAGTNMSKTVDEMRDLTLVLPAVEPTLADYVMIERGEETIELRKQISQQTFNVWQVISPTSMEASADAVASLAEVVKQVALREYVATTQDLAPYGLDEPSAVFMLKDETGLRLYMAVGDPIEDRPSLTYVRLLGTEDVYANDVYAVDTTALAFVGNTRLAALVERYIAMVNIENLDGVRYSLDGKNYDLRIRRTERLDENGNVVMRDATTPMTDSAFTVNGQSVPGDVVRKVYESMIGLVLEGEVTGEANQDAAATLRYDFSGEDAQDIEISFFPDGQDFYAMSRDGSPALFHTRASSVRSIATLFDAALAFPNPEDAEQVRAVRIARDGETYGFERAADGTETYRGFEVPAGKMAEAYAQLVGSTLATGSGTAEVTAEVAFSIEIEYADREPIVLEYRILNPESYTVTARGQQGYFLAVRDTLDVKLGSYEATSGMSSGYTSE